MSAYDPNYQPLQGEADKNSTEALFRSGVECTYNDHPSFNIERAIELFSAVLEKSPNHELALEERSRCYFRLSRHQDRLSDLLRLAELRPHVRLWRDIAECYYALADYAMAYDVLKDLDLDPQQISSGGLRLRAKVCRQLNDLDQAEKDEAQADAYDAQQQSLWDDPNYYGHYK